MIPTQRSNFPPRRRVSESVEDRVLIDADVADYLAMDGAHDSASRPGPKTQTVSWYGRKKENAIGTAGLCPRQFAFVDLSVGEHESRVEDLVANGQPLEIVYLDPKHDGIKQMAEALADQAELDAIFLISDGCDGALRLGERSIDRADLALDHASSLRIIGASLARDGDILLYGSGFTGTTRGLHLIDALTRLTGVEVAALDAGIGKAMADRDWALEALRGAPVQMHSVCVSASGMETDGVLKDVAIAPLSGMPEEDSREFQCAGAIPGATLDCKLVLATASCEPWQAGFSPAFDLFGPRGIRVDGMAIYSGTLSPAVAKKLAAARELVNVVATNTEADWYPDDAQWVNVALPALELKRPVGMAVGAG
ncbi:DUF4347 domain-containing protein [Stieleria mannarensis]|uniref:DUF4347 domain-containing protein n=1 Tax=Stieleria mannarensis TaxID=2755585 RepID=UPI0016034DD7|nr:DUF4347 domain-containing protein [Rhodopirellula sp. JC639]